MTDNLSFQPVPALLGRVAHEELAPLLVATLLLHLVLGECGIRAHIIHFLADIRRIYHCSVESRVNAQFLRCLILAKVEGRLDDINGRYGNGQLKLLVWERILRHDRCLNRTDCDKQW